jgi:hypothetical protein
LGFEEIGRKELLEKIRGERKLLEKALARFDHADYLAPIFDGGWSIKDVLAHLVAWEQQMIAWVDQVSAGVLPDMPNSDEAVDALNKQFFHQNKDLSLGQVLQSFGRSYLQALAVAENTPEEVLYTKNLIVGRENPYWITVAANTFWHYEEHRKALEQYFASKESAE